MATLGKSKDGQSEELTFPEAVVNDKRKGDLIIECMCFFTCYVLLRNFVR